MTVDISVKDEAHPLLKLLRGGNLYSISFYALISKYNYD
jgi:hypothetical protein